VEHHGEAEYGDRPPGFPETDSAVSGFSDVDHSATPSRLVDFLDDAAVAESGIKHYAAAAHSTRHPARPILDVGCGAGHDLKLLASLGLRAVGVDPSGVMLGEARTRGVGSALVRAVGEVLPSAMRCSVVAGSNVYSCTLSTPPSCLEKSSAASSEVAS